ncbi:MAG: GntR family transcriptional regulator [Planctomycetota bacterium]
MYVTKNRHAYVKLQQLIRTGRVAPGDPLPLRPTARRLGMTVSTVQAAIRRLEQDGLVETVVGWGTRVAQPSLDDVRGEYLLRRAIECEAAAIAAENMDDTLAGRLVELAREADAQADAQADAPKDERDIRRYVEADCALHLAIAQASGVKRLVEELGKLHLRSMMWRNTTETVDLPQGRHRPLVDAVLSGDTERAKAVMRSHITVAMEYELRALQLSRARKSSLSVGECHDTGTKQMREEQDGFEETP